MPGGRVPSPENPLLPAAVGWNYSNILPFAQRQQPAQPVQGTDESGKSQQFTSPSVGFALPEVLRSSINELTSAVTLPGRAFQGQVADTDLPRQAIAASLALVGAGAGAEGLGVRRIFQPVEHDPFATELKYTPVDHDPFAAGEAPAARVFSPAELARGRETPVSLTSPAAGTQLDAGRQAQVPDRILGQVDIVREQQKALNSWLDKSTSPRNPQPSALALVARRKAEEAMEAAKKRKRKKGSQ